MSLEYYGIIKVQFHAFLPFRFLKFFDLGTIKKSQNQFGLKSRVRTVWSGYRNSYPIFPIQCFQEIDSTITFYGCLQSAICLHFGENVNSPKSNNYFSCSCSFDKICQIHISTLYVYNQLFVYILFLKW